MRRVGRAVVVVGFVLLVSAAAPAAAVIDPPNAIGCAGSAVITDGTKNYSVDATDTTVRVPREGTAAYNGSISTVTHDHSGSVDLKVATVMIQVGSWGPSKNASNAAQSAGTKVLPAALKNVPPGRYDVYGSHSGSEGRCSGHVTVDVVGSPLSSPFGMGVAVLSAVSALGLLLALKAVPAKAGVGGP